MIDCSILSLFGFFIGLSLGQYEIAGKKDDKYDCQNSHN
jgi:hypothetical protein